MAPDETLVMKSLSYLPRLDGLRALAIGGVLIEHFCPIAAVRAVSPGGAGVTLFFVLSGYLITRILIGYRTNGVPGVDAARHFYFRRILRLAPPYYIAIAVAVIAGSHGLNRHWWIPTFYLTNFQIAFLGEWPGEADHFWSLSVEEQFYILWFFVAVLVPIRYFIWTVACAFAVTFAYRLGVYLLHLSPLTTVLLPAHMASLSTGALLAYSATSPRPVKFSHVFLDWRILAMSGLSFALVSFSLPYLLMPRILLYPFVGSLFFGCLVSLAVNPSSIFLDWLSWTPLRYIGKISYGIFVYHMFIPRSVVEQAVGGNEWLVFAALTVISIAIAAMSWIIIEHPILKMKDRVTLKSSEQHRFSAKICD